MKGQYVIINSLDSFDPAWVNTRPATEQNMRVKIEEKLIVFFFTPGGLCRKYCISKYTTLQPK